MKKSTIVVIIAIYLLSIVLISFLGIKVRVYDEVKYVQEISVSVEAENEDWYNLKFVGKDDNGNNEYDLYIYFNNAQIGEFPMSGNEQVTITKKYLTLSIIPHITYDSGDEANAEEEGIKYVLGAENADWITLTDEGFVTVFKKDRSTRIYVRPEQIGRVGTDAIINVYCVVKSL